MFIVFHHVIIPGSIVTVALINSEHESVISTLNANVAGRGLLDVEVFTMVYLEGVEGKFKIGKCCKIDFQLARRNYKRWTFPRMTFTFSARK